MRETKTKAIGDRGYSYNVTQFGARQGGRVLVRLLKIVGGAAGEAMKSGGESFDMATIGKTVSSLASSVNESDFDWLCDTFAPTTSVVGGSFSNPVPLSTEGLFDLHFAGAYAELALWITFAIEVNFGSFLPAGGLVAQAKDAARRVSEKEQAPA
jgi:hypothetical protein